jgi:hypothetical protein
MAMRAKLGPELWLATTVMCVGVAGRAYIGVKAGAEIAPESLIPLAVVSLPYAIQAFVALAVRSPTGRLMVAGSVVLLVIRDAATFESWTRGGYEAGLNRAFILVVSIAFSLSLALLTGVVAAVASINKQPNKAPEPTPTSVTPRATEGTSK